MRSTPPDALVVRLYRQAKAERWRLPAALFANALAASADRAFVGKVLDSRELERYLTTLHVEDLALACACAAGDEGAWEHFMQEYRPLIYRAADVLGPSAREGADALYADLYGLKERDGERQSLFRYFHGRSSLSTWLRAVLAQRHVDRLRVERRTESLPDEHVAPLVAPSSGPPEPDRPRYLATIRRALGRAVSHLDRKSTRLNSSHIQKSRMPSSA